MCPGEWVYHYVELPATDVGTGSLIAHLVKHTGDLNIVPRHEYLPVKLVPPYEYMSEAEVTKSLHMERRISESSQDDMVALRAKQEKLQELLDITEGKVRGLEQELTTHREAEASQLKKLESNVAAIRQHRDALLAEVRELKQELLQTHSS